MKTCFSFAAILSVLLAFAVQEALAYYDPGVQRWINRDSIGEPGLELTLRSSRKSRLPGELLEGPNLYENLYTFSNNSPTSEVDPFGLEVKSQWPKVQVEACMQCSAFSLMGAWGRAACCIHANTTCVQNCVAEYGAAGTGEDATDFNYKACLADCAYNAAKCAKKGAKDPRKPRKDFPK